MAISTDFCSPARWAHTHFGGVALGDKRRTQRVQTIAAAVLRQAGASIPRLFAGQPYSTKAAYSLFGLAQATPDALQDPHRQLVREQLRQPGVYLLLQDTSELIWPEARRGRRPGLGPVGQGKAYSQGVLLHSLVAAHWPAFDPYPEARRPALSLLGLLDQQFHVRIPIPEAEKRFSPGQQAKVRKARPRESDLWRNSLRQVSAPPATSRWVVVADRAADIFEHLQLCRSLGLGFVVRASQNRALVDPLTGLPAGRLFAVARAQPSLGHFQVAVHARPYHPARQADVQISCSPALALRAPQRPGRSSGTAPAVCCCVVRVWEPAPANGEAGVEWFLLCDQPVTSFAQAHECARQYASRWLMKDFHKALKSGLGVEKLQLQTGHRLFAAVAVLSVVALALVDLREQSRLAPERPAAEAGLTSPYLHLLAAQSRRPVRTIRDVYYALAALGGHLGRTNDGPPGWNTLWQGFIHLRLLVEGARLAVFIADD